MYENVTLPYAISIGISYNEFWEMNPKILNIYIEGHKLKIKEQDMMNWYLGQYILNAVSVSLDSAFNGSKATCKYAKEPFMQNEYFGLSDEEIERKEIEKMIAQEMKWMGINK